MTQLNVLVIEDNPVDAELVCKLLKGDGLEQRYVVKHVPRLQDGVEHLGLGGVDVVLLDLGLPDCQRLDTLRNLRRVASETPIVVVTGAADSEIEKAAVQEGAQDCLSKDQLNSYYLVRAIENAVLRTHPRAEAEQRLRDIVRQAVDAMLVVDDEGIVRFANPAAEQLFGRPAEQLVTAPFGFPIAADERAEIEVVGGKGLTKTAEMRAALLDWDDKPAHLVSLRDTTERNRREAALRELTVELEAANHELNRLATIDPLTEVFNRRGLEQSMAGILDRARRWGASVAVLMVDCDGLKTVNDRYGHSVGDAVLRQVAKSIADGLRPSDLVCRVGGDEFLIVLPDVRAAEAQLIGERVRLAVRDNPVVYSPDAVTVSISVGIEMLPFDTSSVEEMLALTRLSMQRSKGVGKNRVTAFMGGSASGDPATDKLTGFLRRVCTGQDLRAVWQPIVRLTDERVVGHEILSRGPDGPFCSPIALFSLAREHNLQTIVDLRCLRTCIEAVRGCDTVGTLHVNMFPATVLENPLERLLDLFSDVTTSRFCIELSEQQFLGDFTELSERLRDVREAGILIAIDDIGGGRGTLDTVIVLNPDIVKIDRHIVDRCSDDPIKRNLLKRLVSVLNTLGCEIVAEGIERRDDLLCLIDLGVQQGQGYLWSRPIGIDKEQWGAEPGRAESHGSAERVTIEPLSELIEEPTRVDAKGVDDPKSSSSRSAGS